MGRPQDRLRPPLAERGRPEAAVAHPPDDGRPCWVVLGAERCEGTLHAWYRDESSGQWHALVIAWLPSRAVVRRDPEGA